MFAFLMFAMMATTSPSVLTVDLTVVDPTEEQKSAWIGALHNCENVNNVPWIVDTNGKRSYGYVMFQMGTWLKYKNLGATKENISDDEMQKKVTHYILDTKGDDDWWTCGKAVSRALGAYPVYTKNTTQP